jgi:hypothetical protein
VLVFVALGAWLDRARSRDWDAPCVSRLPDRGDARPACAATCRLTAEDFAAL